MAISFNYPLLLLLIPVAILFIFFFRNNLKGMVKGRAQAIVITRSLLFILLILALSGVHIKTYVDRITTVFLVDLSDSTKALHAEFDSFIENALKNSTERDKVGIVTFGQESEVETPILDSINEVEFQTDPGNGFTNIEKGLELAQAIIPEETMKRIVLLTDGEENIGDSLNEGGILKYNNVDLKVYRQKRIITEEVQLKSMEIPKILHENQTFDISVEIYSNIKTKSNITLYSDRDIIGEEAVTIEKGSNRFVFKDTALESGFRPYKVVITPEEDTVIENNSYATFTEVRGKPTILLIDGEEQGGRELNKILSSAGLNVDYIRDREAPGNLSELMKYKSIIMSDVSLEDVGAGFVNSIKSYVGDNGGGLLVTGGENSYALGGYYKTPLEEVLPVDMEMKVKGEVPDLGLILVIDKSGSMGGGQYGLDKMEIAKEAAIRSLNALKPKDKIGIIAFDGAAQWVTELSTPENKDDIVAAIGSIRAGGGTSILPALDEAYLALKDSDSKLKHVILLTDGHAESSGYDALINEMEKAGITISTVAVGEDADGQLLEHIAREGKGRYYFVDEFSTIPEIFTKETFLASKSYINNEEFTPRLGSYHDIISPLIHGVPRLKGYIGSTSKDRAEVVLWSEKDDPILALWQYGLGKSIAWTSDVDGKWTSEYLNSEAGIEFIKNMVEWTLPTLNDGNLVVETVIEENKGKILVKNLEGFDQSLVTKAIIIGPNLDTQEMELKPIKPGEYSEEFPVDDKGVYIIKATQYKDGQLTNSANYATTVNYSREFDFTASQSRLESLVNIADGKFITSSDEVFEGDLENVYGSRDLSRILLILALLLFILDIALRRLNIRFRRIETLGANLAEGTNNIKRKIQDRNKLKEITKVNTRTNQRDTQNKALENLENINEEQESKKKIYKKQGQKSTNNLDTSRLLKAKEKRKR